MHPINNDLKCTTHSFASTINYNHRAVFKVTNTLLRRITALHNFHRLCFAR